MGDLDTDYSHIIPSGATGFWGLGAPEPLCIDENVFKTWCHTQLAPTAWKLLRVFTDLHATNHYRAQIEGADGARLDVLFNPYARCVGVGNAVLVDARSMRMPAGFVDLPFEVTWLPEKWVLHTAEVLNAGPLSRSAFLNLTEAEMKQVDYWNPGTVGELLFNFWD